MLAQLDQTLEQFIHLSVGDIVCDDSDREFEPRNGSTVMDLGKYYHCKVALLKIESTMGAELETPKRV